MVDNLSGYIEIDRLKLLVASETILKLTMLFARFGQPEIVITDGGGEATVCMTSFCPLCDQLKVQT